MANTGELQPKNKGTFKIYGCQGAQKDIFKVG